MRLATINVYRPALSGSDIPVDLQNESQATVVTIQEISVTVAASYERAVLKAELSNRAAHTALDLVDLRPSPDGLLGRWLARFRLRAVHGVIGDAQIYTLLRFLTGDIRWVDVWKETVRRIPSEFADPELPTVADCDAAASH